MAINLLLDDSFSVPELAQFDIKDFNNTTDSALDTKQ